MRILIGQYQTVMLSWGELHPYMKPNMFWAIFKMINTFFEIIIIILEQIVQDTKKKKKKKKKNSQILHTGTETSSIKMLARCNVRCTAAPLGV